MGLMDDVRYALRSLARRPSFTLFAAGTVALGVGSTTAIFSTLEAVVLNPLPYENGDRMVGLFRRNADQAVYLSPTAEQVELWSGQSDLFESVEPWANRIRTLTGSGDARAVQIGLIRPSFHDLLGRPPSLGRAFSADELAGDGARVALLSHGFWRESFGGSSDAVGSRLTLDGEPHTVVGVMPPGTLLPGWGLRSMDIWLPLPDGSRSTTSVTALMREGVSLEQVNERVAALSVGETGDWFGEASLVRDQVARGLTDSIGLLMGAVVLLLLISCVNVSNLLLFRAESRRRETAVRSALGGGRGRLVRQLLTESLVLALLGGVLGIALAHIAHQGILTLRPGQLDVLDHVTVHGRVLGFALALTVGTGLLFGLIPALDIGRDGALGPLKSGARTEGAVPGRRARWMLVGGEVALSFALLVGSLSILSTLIEKQRRDTGFRAEELAVMEIAIPSWRYASEPERVDLYERIGARLAGLPGVVLVSRASGVPPRAGIRVTTVQAEGAPPSEETLIMHGPSVDEAYFQTLGQPILEGRGFTAADVAGDQNLVVLGQETARTFFPAGDAVGGRIRLGSAEEWTTVIGVTPDVAMIGLSSLQRPLQAYHPLRRGYNSQAFSVRVATGGGPSELLPMMRQVVADVDRDVRVDVLTSADELMAATLESERFTTTIMGVFAVLSLLLAAVGLYGVVSQVVGRRTREIGIRMALGRGGAPLPASCSAGPAAPRW